MKVDCQNLSAFCDRLLAFILESSISKSHEGHFNNSTVRLSVVLSFIQQLLLTNQVNNRGKGNVQKAIVTCSGDEVMTCHFN